MERGISGPFIGHRKPSRFCGPLFFNSWPIDGRAQFFLILFVWCFGWCKFHWTRLVFILRISIAPSSLVTRPVSVIHSGVYEVPTQASRLAVEEKAVAKKRPFSMANSKIDWRIKLLPENELRRDIRESLPSRMRGINGKTKKNRPSAGIREHDRAKWVRDRSAHGNVVWGPRSVGWATATGQSTARASERLGKRTTESP